MKLTFSGLFLTGGLLTFALPSAFAAPGNYTDSPLTPQTKPPAAIGNDEFAEENVPGPVVTTLPPRNIPAASVIVTLNMSGKGNAVPPGGTLTPDTIKNITTVTGPTGTESGGDIGSGQQIENVKADLAKYYSGGVASYQCKFAVTFYNQIGQKMNSNVYGLIGNYQLP